MLGSKGLLDSIALIVDQASKRVEFRLAQGTFDFSNNCIDEWFECLAKISFGSGLVREI